MFEQTFKNIDDVLRKEAGCSNELDYTEQTSWLLFLKYLDDLEAHNSGSGLWRGRQGGENPGVEEEDQYEGPYETQTDTDRDQLEEGGHVVLQYRGPDQQISFDPEARQHDEGHRPH